MHFKALDHYSDGGDRRTGLHRSGQFRGGEQLVDAQQVRAPGTIAAFLQPIYQGGLDGVTPGSSCIVNAYTSNHDLIASKETGAFKGFVLHAVDTVGIVHAMLLRVQALLLPIKRWC